jgi:16S rRNA (guanine966-N2)-methyltransferase
MTLRIIGGEFRRRQLKTPPGILTRPYTDRVRQIVFDRLAGRIEDARVADIYSGVGTMGLESISRGAVSCVFFEATPLVHQVLKENVRLLAPDVPTVCWKTDVRYTSFVPKGSDGMLPYNLLYFDPPYARCPDIEPGGVLSKSLSRLARSHVSSNDALLLIRSPERFELPVPEGWSLSECWHLSTMKVWSLVKPPLAAAMSDESAVNQSSEF